MDVDMVFGTPVPGIPTARAAVEYASSIAKSLGYKVRTLLGPDANLQNYQSALTGRVKVVGSVGHGYRDGIVLADGNLTTSWASSLPKKALAPEVIYLNSCLVFNPPFQPAIMASGARTFIGGHVTLLIGPSEEVFKSFWTKALKTSAEMGPTLPACEKATKYPQPGAHRISGDLGKFRAAAPERSFAPETKRPRAAPRKPAKGKKVEIAVLPGSGAPGLSAPHREKIEQLVRRRLLAKSKKPYHKVQVEVERAAGGMPKALVVSMLRAKTYTADVFKVNVDRDYNLRSIEPPVSGSGP
jgi:hypothetical protein